MFSSNELKLIQKLKDSDSIKIELENISEQAKIEVNELYQKQQNFKNEYARLNKLLDNKYNRLESYREEILKDIQRIINEKSVGFPWLVDAISQYFEANEFRIASYLENKRWAAKKAAEQVRDISKEKSELRKALYLTRNILNYYESLFPWINEFVDEGIDETLIKLVEPNQVEQNEEFDPVINFLSKGEYQSLSEEDRNQRALDRYWQRTEISPWKIGQRYERYIGYLYEDDCWDVSYQGIINQREDLGRDLICKKDDKIKIIQCKYWRKNKVIHEKHINQLFGTTVEYYINNIQNKTSNQLNLFLDWLEESNLIASFYSSCSFSETARQFSNALGIEVHENFPLQKYPSIKCNISRTDNSIKIYHLPFDQQYDRVKIEKHRDEFYAWTVKEAESKGFRRAWRWHPER